MSGVNKGNQTVSKGSCAGGRGWVGGLETAGVNREGKAVGRGLLRMDRQPGTEEGLAVSPTPETLLPGSHQQ